MTAPVAPGADSPAAVTGDGAEELDPRAIAARHVRGVRRRQKLRSTITIVTLALLVALAFALAISMGRIEIPLLDVFPAVFGFGDDRTQLVVQTLRLPRALVGLMVGAAFGASGAIFQAFARNPLASPDIIGITSGASAGAVFVIMVSGATSTAISVGALVGAAAAAIGIYVLAWSRGVQSYRLVLVGIGVGAMLDSVISYLFTRARIEDVQKAAVWLVGSLNNVTWRQVRPLTIAMAILIPLLLCAVRPLGVLQFGDDTARGIGQRVDRARLGVTVVAVMLAAVGTAAAGPIAFVAFMAGPIARRLAGTSGPAVIPAALVGSLLVLVADLIGRVGIEAMGFDRITLPVGIITGILGGPYLLWLLARSTRTGAA